MTPPPEDSPPRSYHHGNLAEALIPASLEVLAETGLEGFSLRAVAKSLGVSPGAPFRHYPSKTAILTAVAEEAARLLRIAVQDELTILGLDQPIEALIAVGRAYLRWALCNPTHFTVISSRAFIDFDGSEMLTRNNADLRALMVRLLDDAEAKGILRPGLDKDHLVLGARALVYGLARMATDGHFTNWHPHEGVAQALEGAMTAYVGQLRR